MQYRHGDVWIQKVDNVPDGANPVDRIKGRVILAEGEVTGHAHAIIEDDVTLFEVDGERFVKVENPEGASVVHEEHDTIWLQEGTYRIDQQREYSPEEIRRVAD